MRRREFIAGLGGAPIVPDWTFETPEAGAPSRRSLCVALGIIASVSGGANVKAQEAEPRSYSNTPVGLNFLIAGYVYSEGKMAFDPDLAIADAKFHSNTEVLAYNRSFDVGASRPSSM
jgi:hypothetical protein